MFAKRILKSNKRFLNFKKFIIRSGVGVTLALHQQCNWTPSNTFFTKIKSFTKKFQGGTCKQASPIKNNAFLSHGSPYLINEATSTKPPKWKCNVLSALCYCREFLYSTSFYFSPLVPTPSLAHRTHTTPEGNEATQKWQPNPATTNGFALLVGRPERQLRIRLADRIIVIIFNLRITCSFISSEV